MRPLAIGVAAEWLAVSGTFLAAAVDRAMARRRAEAAVAEAVAAAQPWVWAHRPLDVEDLGGPLDVDEAQVWWRRMQRANAREDRPGGPVAGLGVGA